MLNREVVWNYIIFPFSGVFICLIIFDCWLDKWKLHLVIVWDPAWCYSFFLYKIPKYFSSLGPSMRVFLQASSVSRGRDITVGPLCLWGGQIPILKPSCNWVLKTLALCLSCFQWVAKCQPLGSRIQCGSFLKISVKLCLSVSFRLSVNPPLV